MLKFPVALLLIANANLLVALSPGGAEVLIYPNRGHIIAPTNESFALLCEAKANGGNLMELKWISKNLTIMFTRTESMLKVIFSSPNTEDSGVYSCQGFFEQYQEHDRRYKYDFVTSTVIVDFFEPLRFEDCPENQKLVVNNTRHIKCRVFGNPMPEISWLKADEPINVEKFDVDEFGFSVPDNGNDLFDYEGIYTVEAFVKETGQYIVRKIDVSVLGPYFCEDHCNDTFDNEFTLNIKAETEEEMEEKCKLIIEEVECRINYMNTCPPEAIAKAKRKYNLKYLLPYLPAYREICSDNTLLHAGMVENLKCFGNFNYDGIQSRCIQRVVKTKRVEKTIKVLSEKGLVTPADYGDEIYKLENCITFLEVYACRQLIIESECGEVAMFVDREIEKKIRGFLVFCEKSEDHLLPEVFHLLKTEEQKKHRFSQWLGRNRKFFVKSSTDQD